MYITCPSCSTSYEVDGTKIGREGRAVRCFNCHHTWHQYPVAAQPPPARPASSMGGNARGPYGPSAYGQQAYAREPAYAGGYGSPPYPQAYAPPPQGYQPMPQGYGPPPPPNPFAAPEPVAYAPPPPQQAAPPPPPPPPAPEPKVEASPVDALAAVMAANRAKPAPTPMVEEDLPSDEELDKMLGPERDTSRAFGGGAAAAPAVDDAIDEAEIEKIPDPKPLRQVVDEDEDDFDDDDIDPDDIPDPDPIPTVYQGGGDDEDEDEDEEGGSGLKRLILPAIIIVLLGAIASGLVLGRTMIVGMVPVANDYFYDLIGLHVMVPGDGLKRTLTRTAVETVANVDYVIANGTITNTSDKDQPVPSVFVQLVDAKGQVLDSKEVKPEKDTLKPGEVLNFKATFEGAPATARNVRTEWGKFEESAKEPAS